MYILVINHNTAVSTDMPINFVNATEQEDIGRQKTEKLKELLHFLIPFLILNFGSPGRT